MSQANDKYIPSQRVSDAADALIAAIQAEVDPQHHYLILPCAMSESFLALLRNGMEPYNGDAARWTARGSMTILQAVALSSGVPVPALLPGYMAALKGWFADGLVDPAVVSEPISKPRPEAS